MAKVYSLNIQVETHPPKRISNTAGLDDSFNAHIEVSKSLPEEAAGLSDAFTAFRYTNYINAIDNPHVGPIRIAKIELPGKTLYLCDRLWGSNRDGFMARKLE